MSDQNVTEKSVLNTISRAIVDLNELNRALQSGHWKTADIAAEINKVIDGLNEPMDALLLNGHKEAVTGLLAQSSAIAKVSVDNDQSDTDAKRYKSCRFLMFKEGEAFGMTLGQDMTYEAFDQAIDSVTACAEFN